MKTQLSGSGFPRVPRTPASLLGQIGEAMIIPDSIEPVIGWRAMSFYNEQLHSPSQLTPWPVGEPLQATCTNKHQHGYWRWTVAYDKVPTTNREMEQFRIAYTDGSGKYIDLPPRPTTILPKGVYVLEWYVPPHETPYEDCGCGIYLVDRPNAEVERYVVNSRAQLIRPILHTVVAKTAGWGKVIPGTQGWRVEYAYPQELWVVSSEGRDIGVEGSMKQYGVPIYWVTHFSAVGMKLPPSLVTPVSPFRPSSLKKEETKAEGFRAILRSLGLSTFD